MCGNSTCHECNQQPLCKQNDCSCPVKDLSTDCVLYTGADLTCSGIKSGTILTDLIQQLDDFICKITEAVGGGGFGLINIGTGSGIYRNTLLSGSKELRTLKAIGDFLQISFSSSNEEIEFKETPVEALKKIEMSFDWKDTTNQSPIKFPQDLPSKVTNNSYRRNGFIGYNKPILSSGLVEHPDFQGAAPILIEADIYNLGIKVKDFDKIKDYSPVVVISKYTPSLRKNTKTPEQIPGEPPLTFFPETTFRKGSFKITTDNDQIRLTRVPISKQYQVIDFGQEHYFKTSLSFQIGRQLGGAKPEFVLETRGAKKRYSQCRLPYPIVEAGFIGKDFTLCSAFVYLQFHIEITVDNIKYISKPLGKLKMVAQIHTPYISTGRYSPGDIIPYDYAEGITNVTTIRYKHT